MELLELIISTSLIGIAGYFCLLAYKGVKYVDEL